MGKSGTFDPSGLSALVVDRLHAQRMISLEQLRLMGFGAVNGVSSVDQAWDAIVKDRPNVILIEWFEPADVTLALIRRVRQSDESPNRAVLMFMLTSRGVERDVHRALAAGVDGYLRKPISVQAIEDRVKAAVVNPQPFIVTATYVGPCRRRRQDPEYRGPMRRADDREQEAAAAPVNGPEENARAERMRVSVAALEARARSFASGDSAADLVSSAQHLADLAEQIGDANLWFGAKELIRYLRAQGDAFALDPEVVRTHIAALYQFVHIPQASTAERERVAASLKRMVDKKLTRAAG